MHISVRVLGLHCLFWSRLNYTSWLETKIGFTEIQEISIISMHYWENLESDIFSIIKIDKALKFYLFTYLYFIVSKNISNSVFIMLKFDSLNSFVLFFINNKKASKLSTTAYYSVSFISCSISDFGFQLG